MRYNSIKSMLKYYDLAKLRNVFIRKTKYLGGKVVFLRCFYIYFRKFLLILQHRVLLRGWNMSSLARKRIIKIVEHFK